LAEIARRWQRFEKSSDAYLTVTGMLLVLIVMPILTASNERFEGILTVVIVGATVTIAMAASNANRRAIRASWIASVLIVIAAIFPDTPETIRVISGVALGLMLISTPLVILRRIAKHEVITATTIWGVVAAYMAFGMAFSLMYAVVYVVDPASFPAITDSSLGNFNYFSFVTVTTLGYGDITPATDLPRALAVFETLIGQIYLVVVVARVVSLLGRPVSTHESLSHTLDRDPGPGGDEDGDKGDPDADQGGE